MFSNFPMLTQKYIFHKKHKHKKYIFHKNRIKICVLLCLVVCFSVFSHSIIFFFTFVLSLFVLVKVKPLIMILLYGICVFIFLYLLYSLRSFFQTSLLSLGSLYVYLYVAFFQSLSVVFNQCILT